MIYEPLYHALQIQETLDKYGKRTRVFWGPFYLYISFLWGAFHKTIISLALVGHEMIIVNSAICASLTIPSLIIHEIFSLACDWSKHVT